MQWTLFSFVLLLVAWLFVCCFFFSSHSSSSCVRYLHETASLLYLYAFHVMCSWLRESPRLIKMDYLYIDFMDRNFDSSFSMCFLWCRHHFDSFACTLYNFFSPPFLFPSYLQFCVMLYAVIIFMGLLSMRSAIIIS